MSMTALHPPSARPVRFLFFRVIVAMILREMTTRYGRSIGGYFWAIAEPLGAITLLTIAFSQMMRAPPIGTSFALFYATGYMAFHIYSDISNTVSSAVKVNRNLMRYPSVTPLDAILARFLLSLLTQLVVLSVMLTGIILLSDAHVNLDLPSIALAISMAALLGLGVGTLNCVIFAFVPVWGQLWAVINRPLFIISGVFYLVEELPTNLREIIWYNPLVHPVSTMRAGFYGTYEAGSASPAYVFFLGSTMLACGLLLLRRHRSRIVEG